MMTKGGGGGQKSQKIDDVFYEWPLRTFKNNLNLQIWQNSDNEMSRQFLEFRLFFIKFSMWLWVNN